MAIGSRTLDELVRELRHLARYPGPLDSHDRALVLQAARLADKVHDALTVLKAPVETKYTIAQQNRNHSNSIWIEIDGDMRPLAELCEIKTDVPYGKDGFT
jgi:hypothetical protein